MNWRVFVTMLFGLLPPEVNSGRMYIGPGSGPLRAAATAWDQLADHLYLTTSSYTSEISALAAQWQGPSSTAMAAAAQRYAAWMGAVAGHAELTAAQAAAAATAFENAFAATVPPTVVAANRAQLAVLIATNFFGVNAPAISATEAHYAEMWAQDAAAMDGYAVSASAASVLTPFPPPPDTTDSNGAASQGLALAHAVSTSTGVHVQPMAHTVASTLGQSTQHVAAAASGTPAGPSSVASALSALDDYFTRPLSPFLLYSIGAIPELLGAQGYLLPQVVIDATAAPAPAAAGTMGAGISSAPVTTVNAVWVEAAQADLVGRLSVPPSWAASAPSAETAPVVLTTVDSANSVDEVAMGAADSDALAGQAAPAALAGRGRLFAGAEMSCLPRRGSAAFGGANGPSGQGDACAVAVADNVSNIFVIAEE